MIGGAVVVCCLALLWGTFLKLADMFRALIAALIEERSRTKFGN